MKTLKKLCGTFLKVSVALSLGVVLGLAVWTRGADAELVTTQQLEARLGAVKSALFAMDADEEARFGEFRAGYRSLRNEIVATIAGIERDTKVRAREEERLREFVRQKNFVEQSLKNLEKEAETVLVTKEEILTAMVESSAAWRADGDVNVAKLLASEVDVAQSLAAQQQLLLIVDALEAEGLEKNSAIGQYQRAQEKLAVVEGNIELSREKLQEEGKTVEQKLNYLEDFLENYSGKRGEEAQIFARSSETRKDFLGEIQEKIVEFAASDADIAVENRGISWPVFPVRDFGSFFGDEEFARNFGVSLPGVELVVEEKSPIFAPMDGVVIAGAVDEDSPFTRVMIAGADGKTAVLGFLENIRVEIGQEVTKGEIVARSFGVRPLTDPIFAGQSKVFLGLWDGATAVDPLRTLDLSVLSESVEMPELYRVKFLRDLYARPIDITSVDFLSGATVDERAQNFLGKYARGIYQNLLFWERAVENQGIDRDLVVCIAFAESTLGKFLSTNNNIGNVGNNDRGDRFAFQSPLAGARAITVTLNNRFLGDYHTIDQLSRYGNEDGKIYASSPINWQTNVLKCLTQIKGYFVPEDFPFRTEIVEDLSDAGALAREQVRRGQ